MSLRTAPRSTSLREIPPSGRILPLACICQEQTQWCWAAVTNMILHYHGETFHQQCEFANFVFEKSECCEQPESYDNPCLPSRLSDLHKHLGIRSTKVLGSVSIDTLKNEINSGRPIGVAHVWKSKYGYRGHHVLIYGWQPFQSELTFWVHDPDSNNRELGTIDYPELLEASGEGGEWDLTWIGLEVEV